MGDAGARIRAVSHTPRGWGLVLEHLLDELGAPASERREDRWAPHHRVPGLLHRNERLVELLEVAAARGEGRGLLVVTNRRLLHLVPDEDAEPEHWSLRSLPGARLEGGLLGRRGALVVVTEAGERRFRDPAPARRAAHLVAAINHEIEPPGRHRSLEWAVTPEIAALGDLCVHLDQVRLPGGGVQPIEGAVGAHVDVEGFGGDAPVALHVQGPGWSWTAELPADWLPEATRVAEAVEEAAKLAGPERGAGRDPVLDRLERVERLYRRGILTQEEAVAQKERIVSEGDGDSVPASV